MAASKQEIHNALVSASAKIERIQDQELRGRMLEHVQYALKNEGNLASAEKISMGTDSDYILNCGIKVQDKNSVNFGKTIRLSVVFGHGNVSHVDITNQGANAEYSLVESQIQELNRERNELQSNPVSKFNILKRAERLTQEARLQEVLNELETLRGQYNRMDHVEVSHEIKLAVHSNGSTVEEKTTEDIKFLDGKPRSGRTTKRTMTTLNTNLSTVSIEEQEFIGEKEKSHRKIAVDAQGVIQFKSVSKAIRDIFGKLLSNDETIQMIGKLPKGAQLSFDSLQYCVKKELKSAAEV